MYTCKILAKLAVLAYVILSATYRAVNYNDITLLMVKDVGRKMSRGGNGKTQNR